MPLPIRLTVRPKGRGAVQAGHPWIMADSLILPAENLAAGTIVELVSTDGQLLQRGLFNPLSRIAVRCYSATPAELDTAFFVERLDSALQMRDAARFASHAQALRLVFSEGDYLSGLIVDRYADYLVVHQTAAALNPFMPALVDRLDARYRPKGIVWMVDAATAKLEGMSEKHEWVRGQPPAGPIEIHENGIRLAIDLDQSQKTGYYLDQRENRRAAADWIPPAAKVLDVCCYLGGFGLTIAKRDPTCEVLGIDTSQRAVDAATRNAALNQVTNVRFAVGDFLDTLEKMRAESQTWDAIILDPPKLAGSRDSISRAQRAYHRLNSLAMQLLKPNGILVTCSCSGRVARDEFRDIVRGAARHARCGLQILEQRGAAADHPVATNCPETDYLKCLIARVVASSGKRGIVSNGDDTSPDGNSNSTFV